MAKFTYAFTHKSALGEVARLRAQAEAIKAALHADADQEERDAIDSLIAALGTADDALAQANCPNGMHNLFTIDDSSLEDIGNAG